MLRLNWLNVHDPLCSSPESACHGPMTDDPCLLFDDPSATKCPHLLIRFDSTIIICVLLLLLVLVVVLLLNICVYRGNSPGQMGHEGSNRASNEYFMGTNTLLWTTTNNSWCRFLSLKLLHRYSLLLLLDMISTLLSDMR